MREQDHNPEGCSGDGARGSIGALIRAAADGELSESELAEFERLCAERDCTKDRVRFEQTLRESCGRVMKASPCCSDALRARIRAIAAESREMTASGASAPGAADDVQNSSGPEAMAASTRTVAFWRRSPGMLAAAAVLLSVAGVLIWQASSLPAGPLPPGMTRTEVVYRDRVAGFVSGEHNRCTRSERAAQDKLVLRDADSASAHFAREFGITQVSLNADPIETGSVRFWGAGDCHVPGSSKSAHVRFDATAPDGTPVRLSLFIMPDNQRLPIQAGTTYRIGSDACEESGVALYAWRENGLVYMLVSDAEGEFCSAVRRSLHAPTEVAGL